MKGERSKNNKQGLSPFFVELKSERRKTYENNMHTGHIQM